MNNMIAIFFADFERSLEGLSADDLMKTVRTYLSRGIVACQKGFERAVSCLADWMRERGTKCVAQNSLPHQDF
jgi:hypothetical protein